MEKLPTMSPLVVKNKPISVSSHLSLKRFTLDRRAARDIENAFHAETLSEWLSKETGMDITGDNLCLIVEQGVALCLLTEKYGQTVRYWNPPKNEFQRRENISLFTRACSRLNLSSEPIPNKSGLVLKDVIPCLLELAKLAKQNPRGLREVAASIPDDLNDRLEVERKSDQRDILETKFESISFNNSSLELKLVNSKEVCWGGAMVLLKDILYHQKTKFQQPDHQVICIGLGTSLCGIWASCCGCEAVLVDFPNSIDYCWSNVSENRKLIHAAGGSCGVRAIEFVEPQHDMEIVVKELNPGNLTVLASDFLLKTEELSCIVTEIFKLRSDAQFYIVCHHEHTFQDFFKSLKSDVEFCQIFGDLEYRIIKGKSKN